MMGLRLNGTQGLRPKQASGIAVSVKKCSRCELIYSDPQPIPENVSDHYGVETDTYFTDAYLNPSNEVFDDSRVKQLLAFRPGLRALDIGAGSGLIMRALTEKGWDVWGIEPSEQFARWAVEKVGIAKERISVATLENSEFEAGSFDFITFGAVLEHLYSPTDALAKALSWLKPGGLIHVEVPSSRYLVSKFLNLYYRLRGVNFVTNLSPMHPPYHLFEFSHRSFEENGRRLGYELAYHEYVPGIMPALLHRLLQPLMKRRGTGMQLILLIRRLA